MSTKNQSPQVGVRLPKDLREYVEQRAAENFRSVSSEIAMRVERTRQEEMAKKKDLQ